MQIPESGKNDFFIEILYFTGSSTKFDRPERIPEKYRRSPANQNHRLSRWYAPRLQGDIAGSPTRALKKFANCNFFTGRR